MAASTKTVLIAPQLFGPVERCIGRAQQAVALRMRQLQLAWPQQQGQCPLTYHLFTGVIERD